ncbi:TPA: DUF3265 domain-containing protein, partial [Vibrio vulnificus]|nr:DUF3265 domain-containing protein [Vibrio vulnificus]
CVAFLVCGDFCGGSGVRKLGLCGIHPLTQRYITTVITGRVYGYHDQV